MCALLKMIVQGTLQLLKLEVLLQQRLRLTDWFRMMYLGKQLARFLPFLSPNQVLNLQLPWNPLYLQWMMLALLWKLMFQFPGRCQNGTTYHHETTLGVNENLQFPQKMKLLKKSSYLHLIAPSTIVLLLPTRMSLKHTSRLCGHPTQSSGRRQLRRNTIH